MKNKIKLLLEILLYVVVFIFVFDRVSLLLVRKGNGYGSDVLNFYEQENNSIDLLVLGSSHAYSSFNPYLIEEKTNLKAYNFSTQQQPLWITYYYLKEALKYQNPKYVVLEVHMAVALGNDYAEEQVNRDAIDKMRMSFNKIDVIRNSVEKDDRLSYYFNIIKYHSRYKELNGIDVKTVLFNYTLDNKGYIALKNEEEYFFDKNGIEYTDEIGEISDKNELYLKKIIQLCNKEDIELILVKTPVIYDSFAYGKLNYIKKIANEYDVEFIDYLENIDDLNLDYNNDFYDSGHLNGNGSNKFSLNFIDYLEIYRN